jgi:hypothetical protein
LLLKNVCWLTAYHQKVVDNQSMQRLSSRHSCPKFHSIIFVILSWLLLACTSGIPETGKPPTLPTPLLATTTQVEPPLAVSTPSPTSTPQEDLAIPISVYVLDSESGAFSSQRTLIEVEAIYERVNTIWAQAAIRLDVQTIERVLVPDALLRGITRSDFSTFFDAVNRGQVVLPKLSPIVGFYVRDLGGPNGINPAGSNTFFVMDTPSVHDERVTSHEIGHILGLHHVREDPNRLLYSGTNGMDLNQEEVVVARYAAQGVLDGVR